MERNELIEQLKVVLATAFSLYLKSHYFHWNVTGPNFAQYHEFFGDFYEAVHGDVDAYAEHIRALGEFSPGSLTRFSQLTHIQDEMSIPEAQQMFSKLYADNKAFLSDLYRLNELAEANRAVGLSNFIQDRIDWHEKMNWQIGSFLK